MYEVPCKDCEQKYMAEMKRMVIVSLTKHRYVMSRDEGNGIVVYACKISHAYC